MSNIHNYSREFGEIYENWNLQGHSIDFCIESALNQLHEMHPHAAEENLVLAANMYLVEKLHAPRETHS